MSGMTAMPEMNDPRAMEQHIENEFDDDIEDEDEEFEDDEDNAEEDDEY